jgi:hypothetical protein
MMLPKRLSEQPKQSTWINLDLSKKRRGKRLREEEEEQQQQQQ